MKKRFSLVLVLAFVLALAACSPAPAQQAETTKAPETTVAETTKAETTTVAETTTEEAKADTVTIIDNVGREVTVPFPVQKAAVALRYNNELIRACGAIDQVAVVDMNTAQDREYWANFDPEKTIGKNQKKLNYEAIVESGCDVLILPSNGTYEEAVGKLTPFDIPVVVISGYDTADFVNQVDNIGAMFDKKAEADEFKEYYLGIIAEIKEKLEGVPKRTIYWEATKDYKTSFPGNYYYNMIVDSGAENIFADGAPREGDKEITPEDVIERNPDVIVKNITPDKALSGSGVYDAPALEQREDTIAALKARPGWDTITAVQNGDVYVMSQFGHGGASKMVGAAYIAKWVYPEALADFNPDDVLKHWLEKDQGFRYIEGHFYPRPWENEK